MLLGGLEVVAVAAVAVAAVVGEKEDGLDGYPVLHRGIIKNNYKINEN